MLGNIYIYIYIYIYINYIDFIKLNMFNSEIWIGAALDKPEVQHFQTIRIQT